MAIRPRQDIKDPDATLDWIFDWTDWLSPGESLTSSLMQVTAGLVLDSYSHSATTAVAWVSGGSSGRTYLLSNRITTSHGRTDERSITIRVTQR